MGHGWVPTGVKRHPSLPAGRKADAGEAKGPLLMAFSLPVPAQPLSFIPGLALFSCVGADANVTEGLPCEGCAGNVTQMRRRGHFSRCPEEYRHYCVKGRCRFLVAEAAPACIHCRKQRRKRKEEEMETLNKNVPSRSEDVLETDVA
ncbi:probetacellulin isoform X3 [Centrocercus urophasianus]|uniref:probetacellulin isoform X3 n=1 Tax=Centrocercus urophasianus TaxID=9002 RepID=UPI001C6452CB|nr:probetacellulin isoform X3 [Centrocercus urophasianus]